MMPLSLLYAFRELRAGVRGFQLFLACLSLGVAAIAAAGSTAEAFREGLASQAREILGGDIAVTREGRPIPQKDYERLAALGRSSIAVGGRVMAEAPSGARRLVELRGVSPGYPLVGQVVVEGGGNLSALLETRNGLPGAVVERELLDRLGIGVGDTLLTGNTPLHVRGVLVAEPDRLSRGFALGPRVLTRLDVLEASGVLAGPPFNGTVRLIAVGEDLDDKVAAVRRAVGGKGYRIRDRTEAAPGLRWLIDQLEYFLGFIGLASLIAGGLGVNGAVSAYLEDRRPSIAVLKVLGATGALVRNIYLVQIAVLAACGIAIGLVIGAGTPLVLGKIFEAELPIPALFAIYPEPLWRAAAFGGLAAAAFSLPPLARARRTSPSSLLRQGLAAGSPFSVEMLAALTAAGGLGYLAFKAAPTAMVAGVMIAGVTAAFILLWVIGGLIALVAGRLRLATRGPLRLALANLAGPRSAARTAAPAIGLGVALLAAVVLIQSSLLSQISKVAPRSAPDLVFTDIPGDMVAEFDTTVEEAFGAPLTSNSFLRTPFFTGRIVGVDGRHVDRRSIPERERWAFDNDITMSALETEPANADITAGQWWPAGYRGPPLIALEARAAAAAGLGVGDAVTLSVLGRELETRIAVLRKVELGAFGASFPVIVNAAAIEGANPQHVAIAKASREQEAAAARALAAKFAEVNIISVRDQLEAATDIFRRLSLAVRGAASVAALAGLLVLAGAIAARAQARAREAATLKVLGATRAQILAAYTLEYGAVGLIAGLTGIGLGYAAAWPVIVEVFRTPWSVDWAGVTALVGGTAVLTALGGALAAARALSKPPAIALRSV